MLIDIASTGASELRAVINPSPATPSSGPAERLAIEWERSVQTLRSAGFLVSQTADLLPAIDPALEEETVRIIRESTANLCKHAGPRTRIEMALTLGSDAIVLSWSNVGDSKPFPADSHGGSGLGLKGMRQRVGKLRGTTSVEQEGDHFNLRIAMPLEGAAHD